jgi:hypothetical protein
MLVVAAACVVPAARAQGLPGFRPIFGGAAPPDPNARMSLNMSLALSQAYDEDLLADAGATPQPGVQESGMYTSLIPVVGLTTHGRRFGFSLSGSSNLRRYGQFGRTAATNHNLAGGFSANIGRKTTIVANQAVSYSPSYLYALFGDAPATPTPGAPIEGGADYKTSSFQSYTYATDAALSHSLSPRASFSFNGSMRKTNFVGNVAGVGDMQFSGGGGHYRYSASRGIVLNLGYSRFESRNSLLRTTEHDLESGVGYTRVLSATRRMTFGFNVGPTLAQMELPIEGRWESQRGHLRVIGDASFERALGRTWSTRASYRRGVTYIEALAGPAYTDTASVVATGFINRRADLLFSAAYVTGQMAAQTATAARFTTYTGDARLNIGLSRNMAAYVEGLFYDYAFDPRLIILPGVPSQFTRAGVRVGLTLWSGMTSEHHAAR